MHIERKSKETFAVIGKEGSTLQGKDIVQTLWAEANAAFAEVQPLAKLDAEGQLAGIWGAMTDLSRSFHPWEDHFTKGLYLAGIECRDDAQPPEGWVKWQIPGFEYLCVKQESLDTFSQMLDELHQKQLPLVGAVQEFICPKTNCTYLCFPIRKL